jgi:hypothetical protein
MTKPLHDRRSLVKWAAACSSYLWMEKWLGGEVRAAGKGDQAARILFVYHPDGVFLEQWQPKSLEGDFTDWPESILPLKRWRDQLVILRQLNLLDGQGDGHDESARLLLTGARDARPGSIDVHLAESFRQPLLHVGVLANKAQGHSVSFNQGGAEKVADDSPLAVYQRLFAQARAVSTTLDRDVLRSVQGELQAFLAKLDSEKDRLKLEQHLRQIQILSSSDQTCAAYDLSPYPYEERMKWEDKSAPVILRMQMRNLVEALSCGLSRVATLQISRHTSPLKMDYDWLENYNNTYPMESHQASHNSGEIHAQQKKWFNAQLGYLFKLLAERPEPDPERQGAMLDHTLVVVVTEIAQGASHTRRDMPFYIVGGAGLDRYTTGRILNCQGAPHTQLLWSLSSLMGASPQGAYADAGSLEGLLS